MFSMNNGGAWRQAFSARRIFDTSLRNVVFTGEFNIP
jgi:hypothetical protein